MFVFNCKLFSKVLPAFGTAVASSSKFIWGIGFIFPSSGNIYGFRFKVCFLAGVKFPTCAA
jgi:hypothetical protein